MPRRNLVDLRDASTYIGRHPSYLRRLVDRREIKFYKVGRLIRFDTGDLDGLLDAAAVEPWRE